MDETVLWEIGGEMPPRDPSESLRAFTVNHHGPDQVLQGPQLTLRPATPRDMPSFSAILAEPEVARWWGRDAGAEVADLLSGDGDPDTVVFAAIHATTVIGLLYASEEADEDYRHAGIDITLRTSLHGRGFGREAVGLLAAWLIDVRGHHRLTIDPAADNHRAIACYRAVGFQPVGLMRAYERRDDGRWYDGLLMDLLAAELLRPHRADPDDPAT